MPRLLKTLLEIQRWELMRMKTHALYFVGMLLIPLFVLYFFLRLLSVGLPSDLPIAVVDYDNTTYTRLLEVNLDAMQQVATLQRVNSFAEARAAMQRGQVYGIFVIPKHFTREILSGKRPEITCYFNAAYIMAGSLTFKDMKMMSELVNGKVILSIAEARGISEREAIARIQPIKIEAQTIGNMWLNYSIYLNTMLLPVMLQLMIFFITVFSLGLEIKKGTSRMLLENSGGSMTLLIFGKLSLHFLVFAIYGLLLISLLFYYLHYPLANGFLPIYLAILLMIIASQALGIFFISVLPTLRMGLSFAALVGMLGFSVSGFTFPVSSMPYPIQALTYLFPVRHYFVIYVDQALNGAPFYYSLPHYIMLLSMVLLPIVLLRRLKWAYRDFRYIP